MSENEIKPVAWMLECQNMGNGTGWKLSWTRSGAGVCLRLNGEAHEVALYDQSAIDRLTAERDAALELLDANWIMHQRVVRAEAERDEAQRKLSVAVANGNALVADSILPVGFALVRDGAVKPSDCGAAHHHSCRACGADLGGFPARAEGGV